MIFSNEHIKLSNVLREIVAYARTSGHTWDSLNTAEELLEVSAKAIADRATRNQHWGFSTTPVRAKEVLSAEVFQRIDLGSVDARMPVAPRNVTTTVTSSWSIPEPKDRTIIQARNEIAERVEAARKASMNGEHRLCQAMLIEVSTILREKMTVSLQDAQMAVKRLHGIRDLCGSIRNDTYKTVRIFQDTRTEGWSVLIGDAGSQYVHEDTFYKAIDVAMNYLPAYNK